VGGVDVVVVIVPDAVTGRSEDVSTGLFSFTCVRQDLSADIPAKSKAGGKKFIENWSHGGKDTALPGDDKDASGSHHGEPEANGQTARGTIVKEKSSGVDFEGQRNGCPLTVAQGCRGQAAVHRVKWVLLAEPLRHSYRTEFSDHGAWNDEFAESAGQQIHAANAIESDQRARIGDDG
jgi:hypothetical protein